MLILSWHSLFAELRVWTPAGAVGEFSSPELTLCVYSTPMLPLWHVKDPGHSVESAGGRLHLNTHTFVTQQSWSGLILPLSRHSVGTGNKLTLNLLGNTWPHSSQLAEPLWRYLGIKSWISLLELISTLKKKKSQAGNEWLNILPKPSQVRKEPPPILSRCGASCTWVWG